MSLFDKLNQAFEQVEEYIEEATARNTLQYEAKSQWNEAKKFAKQQSNKLKDTLEDVAHGEPSFQTKVSREYRDAKVNVNKWLQDMRNFCENKLIPVFQKLGEDAEKALDKLIKVISECIGKTKTTERSVNR